MRGALSPRLGLYVGVVGASLLLTALTGRLELLALALPFACATLMGLAAAKEPRLELEREIAVTRVFEGEEISVDVTVSSLTELPLVEIACPLPAGAVATRGSSLQVRSLGSGEELKLNYAFRVGYRSRFDLGPVCARVHAASGLECWETRTPGWTSCVVYPAPLWTRSAPMPLRTRSSAGSYTSRVAGEGMGFLEIRPFVAGDRTRRVNWRASARWDNLAVNQFAAERNADVVLVMDVLSEAGPAGRSVLDMAARGVATLSGHFLRQKNRVGYLELGHFVHWLLPGSGRRQWYRILELLADLRVREHYQSLELDSIPAHLLRPGAFVVGFSPLVDPQWGRALLGLKRRGYDVAIVAPWAPDVLRARLAGTPESALALRIWELELRTSVAELERAGVCCVPWKPEEPLEVPLRALERERQRSRR